MKNVNRKYTYIISTLQNGNVFDPYKLNLQSKSLKKEFVNWKYNFILISILAIFISSCTERIEVELDETYDRLIVEGNLTSDTMTHQFILSKTSPYFSNQGAQKISGANFLLSDDLGNGISLTETSAGIYSTPSDFYGIPERNYEIKIDLAEEIGKNKTYESSSRMMSVDPIDSIGMAFNNSFGRDGFWIIKLYATDPGGIANFYMFNIYRNGELMTDTLDKVSFTDDRLFDGNFTYGVGVAYFNNSNENEKFEIGDTVVMQMAGINETQYTYLNEVVEATSFQNPLFGGPPANVKGNISNGAFGFFGAYSTTYSSIILTEDNIEYEEY